MAQTILVVDDDPVQRRLLEAAITRSGMHVVTAPGGGPALDLIGGPRGEQISLVLLDLVMPDMGGIDVLAKLRPGHPELPVIVLTAKGGIDSAVEAMRAGANDFLVKPASPERIAISIRNQLKIGTLTGEVKQLKKKTENRLTFDDLIATSPEMRQVFRLGTRAAQSNIPILIEGESGAGKELIARAIQGSSERAGKPFITVNCGAIPENLIESILFGHEKGSFTGASDKHLGKFQEADGGTLFLDEIGELRLDMQVKLLRALQEGESRSRRLQAPREGRCPHHLGHQPRSRRAGARRPVPRGPVLPPQRLSDLRAEPARRREDIPALARHFIARFAAEEHKPVGGLTPEAATLLETFNWPGNVRQLENTIFRAVVLCDGTLLDIADFPQIAAALGVEARAPRPPASAAMSSALAPAPTAASVHVSPYAVSGTDGAGHMRKLEDIESEVIRRAISRYDGHMSEVARRLGIGRSTLYRQTERTGPRPRSAAGHDERRSAAFDFAPAVG